MKSIFKIITLGLLSAMMLQACGSDDEPLKPNTNEEEKPPVVVEEPPTVDVSSFCYKDGNITFAGTRVRTSQYFKLFVTDIPTGGQEREYAVEYYVGKNLYQASVADLARGKEYWCRIRGYNYNDDKLMETSQLSFTTTKDSGPEAPNVRDITVIPPTRKNGSDGQLIGQVITTKMEYSANDGESWTAVKTDGSIKGLSSGVVLLRISETDQRQAGKSASITVPEHASNTDPDGDGGKSDGLI